MQLIRQMQQKCVPECTSFVFNMAAEIEGDVECWVTAFMEELQRYESLCNKFSKDYKKKQVRDNCWLALGKKFYMTAEEAEKKYQSIRSSYHKYDLNRNLRYTTVQKRQIQRHGNQAFSSNEVCSVIILFLDNVKTISSLEIKS